MLNRRSSPAVCLRLADDGFNGFFETHPKLSLYEAIYFPQEQFHYLWIEMFARLGGNVFDSLFYRPCFAIRAVTGDCVKHVYNGKETRRQGNFLALQAAW